MTAPHDTSPDAALPWWVRTVAAVGVGTLLLGYLLVTAVDYVVLVRTAEPLRSEPAVEAVAAGVVPVSAPVSPPSSRSTTVEPATPVLARPAVISRAGARQQAASASAATPRPAATAPTGDRIARGEAASAARARAAAERELTRQIMQAARELLATSAGPGGGLGVLGQWMAPLSGYRLTARFGQSGSMWSSDHTGLDFAAPTGTPVVAVAPGTVTFAGSAGAYGEKVEITHADGTETWYAHLSTIDLGVGASVDRGTRIGAVGATGNVTGPHLHLEVRPGGGDPVDPAAMLARHGAAVG